MKGLLWIVTLSFTFFTTTSTTYATSALLGPITKEYCSPEAFDVSCDIGHVILMRAATYGRMRIGRCIGGVALGCKSDVLAFMDKTCSGRRTCKIDVNDLEKVAQPCPKDYKAYLEAQYECVRAISTELCDTQTFISLSEPKGYIVGEIGGTSSQLSSSRCTFSIEVGQGQRVAVYMYTIGEKTSSTPTPRNRKPACHDHLTIEDGPNRKTTNLCDVSRNSRQLHLYTSSENSVVIHTRLGRTDKKAYFMIQYRAVGCPDVQPPPNSWLERSGEDLVVRCNTTGDIWYLTCQGSDWVGQIGNCTQGVPGFGAVFGKGIPIQQGIALAVGVGILVGGVFGALLLLCVWTIKKGSTALPAKPIKRPEAPPTKTYVSEERTNYPALLAQERGQDGTMYEYTHVWDPRSQSLEKRPDKKHYPSSQGSQYSTDTISTTITSGRTLSETPHSRMHLYETPKGVCEEDARRLATEAPVYYDLDPDMNREKIERPH